MLLSAQDRSTQLSCFSRSEYNGPITKSGRKFEHMIMYLVSTRNLALILSADDSGGLYWYADNAFAVHPNMRSHNGAGLKLGRGFAIRISSAQRLNVGCSTHAEIV